MSFKFKEEKNNNLILIHKEEMKDVKCAVCDASLTLRVYTRKGKIVRIVCCDNCKTETEIRNKV